MIEDPLVDEDGSTGVTFELPEDTVPDVILVDELVVDTTVGTLDVDVTDDVLIPGALEVTEEAPDIEITEEERPDPLEVSADDDDLDEELVTDAEELEELSAADEVIDALESLVKLTILEVGIAGILDCGMELLPYELRDEVDDELEPTELRLMVGNWNDSDESDAVTDKELDAEVELEPLAELESTEDPELDSLAELVDETELLGKLD